MENQSEEKLITVVPPEDNRHYTIIVETTTKTSEGTEAVQILNLFADSPAGAYQMLLNLQQIYTHQPNTTSIKLIGVYRRTVLEVVDKKIGE